MYFKNLRMSPGSLGHNLYTSHNLEVIQNLNTHICTRNQEINGYLPRHSKTKLFSCSQQKTVDGYLKPKPKYQETETGKQKSLQMEISLSNLLSSIRIYALWGRQRQTVHTTRAINS